MNGGDTPHTDDSGAGWQFKPGDTAEPTPAGGQPTTPTDTSDTGSENGPNPQQPAPEVEDIITWTASEFIEHNKGFGWYALLALATIVLAGLIFLLTRDKMTTTVVIVAGIIFGVYAARKPRTLNYRLDAHGLTIGEKFYDYGQFRSFTVVREGIFSSVDFMPLKRFMPILTIYYEPKDEPKIARLLSERLPTDFRKRDWFEQLMHQIRY